MTENNWDNPTDKSEYPRKLGRSITYLHRQKVKFMNSKLKEYDIFGSMYMILLHVARRPGSSQDAIGMHLHIDKCTIARRTKRLEELGYLYRVVNELDHRQNNLYPTERGNEVVPVITENLSLWSELISVDLSDSEKATLVELLDKLIHACDE